MRLLICLISVISLAQSVRVNSGGPAYTDTTGNKWAADFGSSGGSTFSTTLAVAGALPAAADQVLYQTERFGNLTYTFSVSNGQYNVTLKFAELYWTVAGKRLFNVSINGTAVLTSFDIFAAAGNKNFTAVDKTFSTTVTSGSIAIQFVTVADNAKIGAIDIEPVNVAPPAPGQVIAGGQAAMPTATLAPNSCSSVIVVGVGGILTTDTVDVSYFGDPTAVPGYGPGGGLTIRHWTVAGGAAFKLCNETANSNTPGPMTINWTVTRGAASRRGH